jgi:adenylate cyclase
MLIGNIGGGTHYEYTAVGDIINTSSRIEGLNKLLGTRLLASPEVLVDLKDFLTRELGKFLLRGKSKAQVVYEVVACATDCNSDQERLCKNFSAALDLFRHQKWAEARKKFEEILSENVADGPSGFYLNLCKDFKENPPWEGWDGMIRVNKI